MCQKKCTGSERKLGRIRTRIIWQRKGQAPQASGETGSKGSGSEQSSPGFQTEGKEGRRDEEMCQEE